MYFFFSTPLHYYFSYEGDLLAAAGATMTWSRESAAHYGEINGGRRSVTPTDNFNSVHINPFWDPSAEHPIALPHVTTAYPGEASPTLDVPLSLLRCCPPLNPVLHTPLPYFSRWATVMTA